MNRNNAIERLMLSRCSRYHEDGEILDILENRYSISGLQKNYLVLESTDGGITRQQIESGKKRKRKTLLGSILVNEKRSNKFNPLKTKNEFKRFIKTSLASQAKAGRQLKKLLKENPVYLDNVKDVGDLSICKEVLKVEDFTQINTLWNDYIKELVGSGENISVVTGKLSSGEFIGAEVEVTHSGCIDNVGKRGIVIWESQYNFAIVVPRQQNWKSSIGLLQPNYSANELIGGLRLINKQDTRFRFSVHYDDDKCVDFEILGDRLMLRSIDRANKKFKAHSVRDINL